LAIAALLIRHYVELELLTKVPFFQKHKAILLKVYQVKYTTAKNTVFRTFGCANYVSTAGGYATVMKGLKEFFAAATDVGIKLKYSLICSEYWYMQ